MTVTTYDIPPLLHDALADLEDWPHGPTDAHLTINSRQADFNLVTSCAQESLFGEREFGASDSCLRVHVTFDPRHHGPDAVVSGLLVVCDSIDPFTNGIPLDIETWQSEYVAWWEGWKDHWSDKSNDNVDCEVPAIEDTIIAAGEPENPEDGCTRTRNTVRCW